MIFKHFESFFHALPIILQKTDWLILFFKIIVNVVLSQLNLQKSEMLNFWTMTLKYVSLQQKCGSATW
jgi:hypothetical protein